MRKIIYWVHTSVDGFIAGPNGEFDWPVMSPELGEYSNGLTDRVDTFLYGRVVWELMASYWPTADQLSDDPHDVHFAKAWREKTKVVISRTLTDPGWGASTVAELDGVRALKERPGKDMLLTGGGAVAAGLAELDLIDEYQIVVHPVVLGGGKQVFPAATRFGLRLAETRAFDGRAVLMSYVRE
jgi:dihydrofolate reductase